MNQRLWTGEELLACSYKTSVNRGVTIGIYDYTYCKERTLVDVEEFDAGKLLIKELLLIKNLLKNMDLRL